MMQHKALLTYFRVLEAAANYPKKILQFGLINETSSTDILNRSNIKISTFAKKLFAMMLTESNNNFAAKTALIEIN
jgi:hypothetical protein